MNFHYGLGILKEHNFKAEFQNEQFRIQHQSLNKFQFLEMKKRPRKKITRSREPNFTDSYSFNLTNLSILLPSTIVKLNHEKDNKNFNRVSILNDPRFVWIIQYDV